MFSIVRVPIPSLKGKKKKEGKLQNDRKKVNDVCLASRRKKIIKKKKPLVLPSCINPTSGSVLEYLIKLILFLKVYIGISVTSLARRPRGESWSRLRALPCLSAACEPPRPPARAWPARAPSPASRFSQGSRWGRGGGRWEASPGSSRRATHSPRRKGREGFDCG